MGRVEFQRWFAAQLDEEGLAQFRALLVEDLAGDVVEIGAGTGAMFHYYGDHARVTAIKPDDEFRTAAEDAATSVAAAVRVVPGVAESLPFDDGSVDGVVASTVLCSVQSVEQTLKEFKRVLKPGANLRLLEHVRSEHRLAGPLMDLFNPMWLRINKMGCNMNRRSVEAVRDAGFRSISVDKYKPFFPSSPAPFPIRLIKADR